MQKKKISKCLLITFSSAFSIHIFSQSLESDIKNQLVWRDGEILAQSQSPPTQFSHEGYSGLVFIPSGEVMSDGEVAFDVSSAMEPRFNEQYSSLRNYALGIGFLPRLEVAGRVAEFRDLATGTFQGSVDLSAHVKLQILREGFFVPALALGIQDLGGESDYFDTKYLALSKTLGKWVRLTAGYGLGPDRLDGFFSGLEIAPMPWALANLETDTGGANAGATIYPLFKMPKKVAWVKKLYFKMALVDLQSDRDVYGGFGISLPLAGNKKGKTYIPKTSQLDSPAATGLSAVAEGNDIDLTPEVKLQRIKHRLIDCGFENIGVVQNGQVLSIAYENRMHALGEVHALGRVLGIAKQFIGVDVSSFNISILRQNIEILQLKIDRSLLAAFLKDEFGAEVFAKSLDIVLLPRETLGTRMPAANRSTLHSDLFLFPIENHSVGTDLGSADLKLGLLPELRTPLWSGGLFRVSYQFHLLNTEPTALGLDFENEFENIMIHQAIALPYRLFNQTSFGDYGDPTGLHDPALFNETLWYSEEGRLRLKALVGSSFDGSYDLGLNRKIATLSGQYRLSVLDLTLAVEGGHFLYRDTGYVLSLARSFGRTDIGFQYLHSERGTQGGVFLQLPLTFAQEPVRPGYLRPRLPDLFATRLRTRLFNPVNDINLRVANLPPMRYRLEDLYFDGDRLTPTYMRAHVEELREAIQGE